MWGVCGGGGYPAEGGGWTLFLPPDALYPPDGVARSENWSQVRCCNCQRSLANSTSQGVGEPSRMTKPINHQAGTTSRPPCRHSMKASTCVCDHTAGRPAAPETWHASPSSILSARSHKDRSTPSSVFSTDACSSGAHLVPYIDRHAALLLCWWAAGVRLEGRTAARQMMQPIPSCCVVQN